MQMHNESHNESSEGFYGDGEPIRSDHIPSMSVESQLLIAKLKGGTTGDELTDDELKEVCGRNTSVGESGYSYLQTAIRYCERRCGVVWRRVVKAGRIRCCSSTDRIELSSNIRDRQRKMSRRALVILSSANGTDMTDKERSRALSHMAMHGAMLQFTDQKKLASVADEKADDWKKYLTAVK
jgi:hypothetical protein